MRSRLHEMCEFIEMDGADYRELPANGGVDDLITLWKMRKKGPLPSRARPPGARASCASPAVRDGKADLKWPGDGPDQLAMADGWQVATACRSHQPSPSAIAMLGLYVHVPFCSAICNYCNFNRGLFDGDLKLRYVDALCAEIAGRARQVGPVRVRQAADTIFFGGGTPSLLEPDEIARIIAACESAFDVAADREVTLEANPETVTEARLAAFRRRRRQSTELRRPVVPRRRAAAPVAAAQRRPRARRRRRSARGAASTTSASI